jgi:soluble lytic murein transglycosylase-like protein
MLFFLITSLLLTCAHFTEPDSSTLDAGGQPGQPAGGPDSAAGAEYQGPAGADVDRLLVSEGLRQELAEREIWIDEPRLREAAVYFFEELAGSRELAHIVLAEAEKYGVPAPLAFALVWKESSFNPYAVNENSSSVDRGLFQLNSRSFPDLTEKEFFDARVNARHGLAYLSRCLKDGGNEVVALAMYNAGRTRVTQRGTPKMTLDYIAKVLEYRERIEQRLEIYVRQVKSYGEKVAYVVDRGERTK